MRVGSLFSGIGGIDLGLERAGMEIAWQVEIDEWCRRVLAKHWPNVERFGDIRECGAHNLAAVDVLAGGFPCQDVSHAGPRTGMGGARSGLWAEFDRLIGELRPPLVLVENVTGLLDRGMARVIGDLAGRGYDAEWGVISACAFGAPHARERVFIVAYPESERPRQLRWSECPPDREAERNLHWPESEPRCERVAHGIPHRVDRLRGLGNAVVPQIVEWIGRRIMEDEHGR